MRVQDRAEYLALHPGLTERLAARAMMCEGVNYGY